MSTRGKILRRTAIGLATGGTAGAILGRQGFHTQKVDTRVGSFRVIGRQRRAVNNVARGLQSNSPRTAVQALRRHGGGVLVLPSRRPKTSSYIHHGYMQKAAKIRGIGRATRNVPKLLKSRGVRSAIFRHNLGTGGKSSIRAITPKLAMAGGKGANIIKPQITKQRAAWSSIFNPQDKKPGVSSPTVGKVTDPSVKMASPFELFESALGGGEPLKIKAAAFYGYQPAYSENHVSNCALGASVPVNLYKLAYIDKEAAPFAAALPFLGKLKGLLGAGKLKGLAASGKLRGLLGKLTGGGRAARGVTATGGGRIRRILRARDTKARAGVKSLKDRVRGRFGGARTNLDTRRQALLGNRINVGSRRNIAGGTIDTSQVAAQRAAQQQAAQQAAAQQATTRRAATGSGRIIAPSGRDAIRGTPIPATSPVQGVRHPPSASRAARLEGGLGGHSGRFDAARAAQPAAAQPAAAAGQPVQPTVTLGPGAAPVARSAPITPGTIGRGAPGGGTARRIHTAGDTARQVGGGPPGAGDAAGAGVGGGATNTAADTAAAAADVGTDSGKPFKVPWNRLLLGGGAVYLGGQALGAFGQAAGAQPMQNDASYLRYS